MSNKIKRRLCKLTKITAQVEQIEVKRKLAQIAVSGGDDGTSITTSSIFRTSVSTVTTITDLAGLVFGGKNSKKHKIEGVGAHSVHLVR